MKGKMPKTREDLILIMKSKGLTLKKMADESGFPARNIENVISGVITSSALRQFLEDVTATETFFEKISG